MIFEINIECKHQNNLGKKNQTDNKKNGARIPFGARVYQVLLHISAKKTRTEVQANTRLINTDLEVPKHPSAHN